MRSEYMAASHKVKKKGGMRNGVDEKTDNNKKKRKL